MADLNIKGQDITIDLEQMTVKEFRSLFDKSQSQAEEDVILARVCGVTPEYLECLSFVDYKRLSDAFFKKARDPLSDPN